MILTEIDYDYSSNHVKQEVTRIQQEILSGSLKHRDAISELNALVNQLKVEISLAELELIEKAKFHSIFVFINIIINDIARHERVSAGL